jgi:hypothetical protein
VFLEVRDLLSLSHHLVPSILGLYKGDT